MNRMALYTSAVAATLGSLGWIFRRLSRPHAVPVLDYNRWWGMGTRPQEEDTSVRPFVIKYTDEMIDDLKSRVLNRRQFTKNLETINSEYGVNIPFLENILKYWVEDYDFKQRVEKLNRFSHYKTRIQGLDIHFIREIPVVDRKGKANKKVLPLLMLHGWPSSSKEFDKVIPLLTTPKQGYDFVFEVIAADLPGFGFSEPTNKVGLNAVQMGIIMRNLMKRLGHKQFYIQAGDWGSQCATHMATLFPDEVLGFHTNMPISSRFKSMVKILLGAQFPRLVFKDRRHLERIYPLKKLFTYIMQEGGYFHIQATKPDTIGVALMDSPSGLAAYIIEKMAMCTNRDQLNTSHGGLANLDINDVLDTVTIQWMNRCIVTSMRIYAEGIAPTRPEINAVHRVPTKVPTAAVNFLYEVLYQPDCVLRDKFTNLVQSRTFNFGGHFAAMEVPQVLVNDVFDAAVQFQKFHGT